MAARRHDSSSCCSGLRGEKVGRGSLSRRSRFRLATISMEIAEYGRSSVLYTEFGTLCWCVHVGEVSGRGKPWLMYVDALCTHHCGGKFSHVGRNKV